MRNKYFIADLILLRDINPHCTEMSFIKLTVTIPLLLYIL